MDTAAAHLTVMVAELASTDLGGVARLDCAKQAMSDLHSELASAGSLQPISVQLSGLSSFRKQVNPADPEPSTKWAVPPCPGLSVLSLWASVNPFLVSIKDDSGTRHESVRIASSPQHDLRVRLTIYRPISIRNFDEKETCTNSPARQQPWRQASHSTSCLHT